jgi:hypothetical protein
MSEPTCGTISLAEPVFGQGWSPPVPLSAEDPTPVRWTGPLPVSELYLNLPKDSWLNVECVLRSAMAADLPATLRLSVNGWQLPVFLARTGAEEFPQTIRAFIPLQVLREQPGMVKLEFRLRETLPEPVPSEPDKGPKRLGIAVEKLTVRKILPNPMQPQPKPGPSAAVPDYLAAIAAK